MENYSTPSVAEAAGTNEVKMLFSPFSPYNCGTDYREEQSIQGSIVTPKRKLSLNLDESMQSPLSVEIDSGCDDSSTSRLSGSTNEGLLLGNNRTPLCELNTNCSDVTGKRRILHAKRLKKGLVNEKNGTFPMSAPSDINAFKKPSQLTLHSTRPSSLPSLAESNSQESTEKSWIGQINSPLEKMTLISPSGQVALSFGSHSTSSWSQSISSLPPGLSSLTSATVESDGYFSEIDVFDNEDTTDSTSDTIKTLFSAPLASNLPLTFSSSKIPNLPCPRPVRPQRANSSPQMPSTTIKRSSLKRSSPSSELAQLHQPKRPPLPFLHCSNSQDSPITPPSPLSRHLKGRSLLRSQSYCTPLITGEEKLTPLSPKELIGDDTMPYALPLVRGSSPELKCISPETLHKLLAGKFSSQVEEYTLIDCRYPYEYKGGHIQGAVNIWEKANLINKFLTNPEHPKPGKRIIYIFHCEFSSKRGPEMCRFLRKIDREKNGFKFFPKLYYPELYLLEGGYKDFYHAYNGGFCDPRDYCPMLNEKHAEDLRHFKQRAKSWAGDSVVQSRRQVPSRCRRRTTANFDSRPKSNSLDSNVKPHK